MTIINDANNICISPRLRLRLLIIPNLLEARSLHEENTGLTICAMLDEDQLSTSMSYRIAVSQITNNRGFLDTPFMPIGSSPFGQLAEGCMLTIEN